MGDRLSVFLIIVAATALLESSDDCCGEMYNAAVLLDRSSMDGHVRDADEKIFLVIAVCLGIEDSRVLTLQGS